MKKYTALLLLAAGIFMLTACGKAEKLPQKEATADTAAELFITGTAGPMREPPNLGLITRNEETVSCTYVSPGSYSWTYPVGDGRYCSAMVSRNHCAASFASESIPRIESSRTEGSIAFSFFHTAESFSLSRFSEEACLSGTYGDGEAVPTFETADGPAFSLAGVSLPCLYAVFAEYAEGSAEYAFRVDP